MSQIDINQARGQLETLLNEAIKGQEIIITENDQPLVKLSPLAARKAPRPLGTAEGQIWMADDFNDSFEEYGEDVP
jgi:prevent-host-death family protein